MHEPEVWAWLLFVCTWYDRNPEVPMCPRGGGRVRQLCRGIGSERTGESDNGIGELM